MVIQAADGETAIEQCIKEKPDLITLDITLPEMSGVKYYKLFVAQKNGKIFQL